MKACEQRFIEHRYRLLLDIHGEVRVGAKRYLPSTLLKAVDPEEYRHGLNRFTMEYRRSRWLFLRGCSSLPREPDSQDFPESPSP